MTKRKLSNIQKNFTAVIYRTALMLKRIGNRISFGCYYYLYDGNRRI